MNNFFFYTDTNFFLNFTNFIQSREQTNAEVVNSVSGIIEDVKVNASFSSVKTNPPKPDDDVFNTVVSALIGLGYKKSEAVNMFNDNFDESTSAEDIIIRILS